MNALNTNRINVNSPYKARDWYLFRVLQNSKITYRPHCPGMGGGALLTPQVSILRHDGKLWRFFLQACLTRASSVSDGDGFHT